MGFFDSERSQDDSMLDLVLGGVLEASWSDLGKLLGGQGALGWPKMAPRRRRMVPISPKMARRRAMIEPRHPKMTPRRANMPLNQDGAKTCGAEIAQDGAKTCQDGTKACQDGAQTG